MTTSGSALPIVVKPDGPTVSSLPRTSSADGLATSCSSHATRNFTPSPSTAGKAQSCAPFCTNTPAPIGTRSCVNACARTRPGRPSGRSIQASTCTPGLPPCLLSAGSLAVGPASAWIGVAVTCMFAPIATVQPSRPKLCSCHTHRKSSSNSVASPLTVGAPSAAGPSMVNTLVACTCTGSNASPQIDELVAP